MNIHYDVETDSLYIGLREQAGVDAVEVSDGVVLDLDVDGRPVGIDIQHASTTVDLSALETVGLPALRRKLA